MSEPFEVEVRTRHGAVVRADVFLPAGRGPHPVLFMASPYQKSLRRLPTHWVFPFRETGPMDLYLSRGYAFVWADVPGTGRSEGTWDPVSRAEGEALRDVIEWIAAQEWSGRIGMYGQSYYCWSQWNAARTRPPHLATIVAFDGAVDTYRDWTYHGGIPTLGFPPYWTTTVLLQHQAEGHDVHGGDRYRFLSDLIEHPLDDEWQRTRSPFWELDRVDIPVLSIGNWGKAPLHLRGNVVGFERIRGPKQLLITHADSFPAAQRLFADPAFHEREVLPWYEHHLRGVANGVMERPRVRYFLNGEGAYRDAAAWPPEEARRVDLWLSGERSGALSSLNDASLTEAGAPANGSFTWSYPDPLWLAGNSTFRSDGTPDHVARTATYTSPPLARDRELVGNGVVVLHVSTDQSDMDVIANVHVLSPDGRLRRITQGWLRASHRREDPSLTSEMRPFHAHDALERVEPGRVYELRIELLPYAYLARAGDRIVLQLSNTDSPLADGWWAHWYAFKVGSDTYHHGAAHPSRLTLMERTRAVS